MYITLSAWVDLTGPDRMKNPVIGHTPVKGSKSGRQPLKYAPFCTQEMQLNAVDNTHSVDSEQIRWISCNLRWLLEPSRAYLHLLYDLILVSSFRSGLLLGLPLRYKSRA
jgi:hypothetical protein